jgi:hypothetical protein
LKKREEKAILKEESIETNSETNTPIESEGMIDAQRVLEK